MTAWRSCASTSTSTPRTEHGYDGDRLAYLARGVDAASDPSGPTESLTTYRYDDQGRPLTEERREDGVLWTVATHGYDELGQRVETYTEFLDWQEDWRATYTREEGRLRRFESQRVDLDGPSFVEDHAYLQPAPSLDADVFLWPDANVRRLYGGENLIEETRLDGPDPVTGFVTTQWVWRDDRQIAVVRYLGDDLRFLFVSEFDAEGHKVATRWGPDADGDDVLDEVTSEQSWTWSCE